MKGFVITHKGQQIKIGVDEGLSVINLWYLNPDRNFIDISTVDYKGKKKEKWVSFAPIDVNDCWKIEFTEIDTVSPPIESVRNDDICSPVDDKLERFRRLEKELKEFEICRYTTPS